MDQEKKVNQHQGKQLEYLIEHSPINNASAYSNVIEVSASAVYQMIDKPVLKPKRIKEICKIFQITTDQFLYEKLEGLNYPVVYPEKKDKSAREEELLEEIDDLKNELIADKKEISGLKDEIIELNRQIIKLYKEKK